MKAAARHTTAPSWTTRIAAMARGGRAVRVRVEKGRFDTDDGTRTWPNLGGRSQLMFYHFMFGPSYEAGCPVNSSMADGMDGLLPHLHARDVTLLLARRRRWTGFRRTSGGWAGASPGSRRRRPTSTWTSAAPTPGARCASWGLDEGGPPPVEALNAAAAGPDVPAASGVTCGQTSSPCTRHGHQSYPPRGAGKSSSRLLPGLNRVPKEREVEDAASRPGLPHGESRIMRGAQNAAGAAQHVRR